MNRRRCQDQIRIEEFFEDDETQRSITENFKTVITIKENYLQLVSDILIVWTPPLGHI